MIYFRRVTIIIITLFVFSGCIRVETIIRVNKDGSGTITETVMMSKVFADMMRSFSESFGDLGADELERKEFSLFDEEKLNRQAAGFGEDVIYKGGRKVTQNDWEGYSAVYTFSDISKIRLNTSQEDKVDTGMGGPAMGTQEAEPEEEREFYYFTLERGKTSMLVIHRTEIKDQHDNVDSEPEEDGDMDLEAMNTEMLNMFDGMRFTMKVEVDGKISKTNASYREGSVITLLDMDMSEMMKNKEAFSELTRKKPETTEEMKAFTQKFEGLKLEFEQPVSVSFR